LVGIGHVTSGSDFEDSSLLGCCNISIGPIGLPNSEDEGTLAIWLVSQCLLVDTVKHPLRL
jgi:hypothetical protein